MPGGIRAGMSSSQAGRGYNLNLMGYKDVGLEAKEH